MCCDSKFSLTKFLTLDCFVSTASNYNDAHFNKGKLILFIDTSETFYNTILVQCNLLDSLIKFKVTRMYIPTLKVNFEELITSMILKAAHVMS